MMRDLKLIAVIALFSTLLLAAAFTTACSQPTKQDAQTIDLNKPVPEAPPTAGMDIAGKNPEEIWIVRCGQCHSNERGLDRYKGDEWEPLIKRMMKKPGAMLNTSIARVIFIYLWERTTGKLHPDREEVLNAPTNTAGMGDSVGGSSE